MRDDRDDDVNRFVITSHVFCFSKRSKTCIGRYKEQ